MGSNSSTSRMEWDDPDLNARSDESSDPDQETDLATILQYLIRRYWIEISVKYYVVIFEYIPVAKFK